MRCRLKRIQGFIYALLARISSNIPLENLNAKPSFLDIGWEVDLDRVNKLRDFLRPIDIEKKNIPL